MIDHTFSLHKYLNATSWVCNHLWHLLSSKDQHFLNLSNVLHAFWVQLFKYSFRPEYSLTTFDLSPNYHWMYHFVNGKFLLSLPTFWGLLDLTFVFNDRMWRPLSLLVCACVGLCNLCRRRLPSIMLNLRMAQNLKTAITFIEQGRIFSWCIGFESEVSPWAHPSVSVNLCSKMPNVGMSFVELVSAMLSFTNYQMFELVQTWLQIQRFSLQG